MTAEYRWQFTLSTFDPKGDVNDTDLYADLNTAVREVFHKHDVEVVWEEFDNITDEIGSDL